jgi:hypothetical protein
MNSTVSRLRSVNERAGALISPDQFYDEGIVVCADVNERAGALISPDVVRATGSLPVVACE